MFYPPYKLYVLQDSLDPITSKLMDVLARTNINLIACSVGCLSNLTCNNPVSNITD